MKRFLVTGGAGFIGSHLCDTLLAAGCAVDVLDDLSTGRRENVDARVTLIEGNIQDEQLVRQLVERCVGVFHLAAIASVPVCVNNWLLGHSVNVVGSIKVFMAAADAGVPVVYASSAAVYGDAGGNRPASEDMIPRPLGPYGADKLACEHQAYAFYINKGLSSVGLRFFNVFGPRQDPSSPYSGVISRYVDAVLHDCAVTVFGDGLQRRDFIGVFDIVQGMILAMEHARASEISEVINLCTGHGTSILELANLVAKARGVEPLLDFLPARAGDIKFSVGDPKKANSVLGFRSEAGIERTLKVFFDKLL